MASHHQGADYFVKFIKENADKGRTEDPTYCAVQSREHLLRLMFYSSELISVAKGIRFFLGVITLLLVLMLLGVITIPRS